MKKCVMILVVTAILLVSWEAALGKVPLKFGLRGGVSISNLDYDPELVDSDSRTAFTGGGFLVIDLSGIWAIQAELLYAPKGATYKQQGTDENAEPTGEFTMTNQINYLEIPILARVSLGSTPLFVLAGPALDIKLSSKITSSDSPYGPVDDDWTRITAMDLGLVFGGGAAFPVSFGELLFDVRYTVGMSNVHTESNADIKNSALTVTAGVTF